MVVTLSGSANIREIEGLRSAMLEAFHVHGDLELDIAQVEDADLSFLQLVEAARKLAVTENKELRLTAPASPTLTALLERAGFLADDDLHAGKFWLEGEVG